MKNYVRLTALLAVLILAGGFAAMASEDVTMQGGYVWQREDGAKEGELTAVFTPNGEGKWNVAFSFDWDDGPHTYTGSCEGSLSGALSGDIAADGGRKMNFRFAGAFAEGKFTGTHSFVNEDGSTKDSGTLTLAAAMGDQGAGHADDDGHAHDHDHDHAHDHAHDGHDGD